MFVRVDPDPPLWTVVPNKALSLSLSLSLSRVGQPSFSSVGDAHELELKEKKNSQTAVN